MDGVNTALLNALPDASNVLELGCATGLLGKTYKAAHPSASWHGIDINQAAVDAASSVIDSAVRRDLDTDSASTFGQGYDLIVLGDVLEHLRRPEALLADLHVACTPDAQLACCMPNLGHVSVIERILAGDVMYDDAGLLDRTHLRFFTPRSVFKMFMDCGWLPSPAGGYRGVHPNAHYVDALYAAASALGISRAAAEYNLETYQLIIRAKRWDQPKDGPPLDLTVVVNATNELQCSLNIARSPGLEELDAKLLLLRSAPSAAAALREAAAREQSEWFLVAQQNVYLPKGAGFALARSIRGSLVALVGSGEALVLVHRSQIGALNAAAGWESWATGQAGVGERIDDVPYFHNV